MEQDHFTASLLKRDYLRGSSVGGGGGGSSAQNQTNIPAPPPPQSAHLGRGLLGIWDPVGYPGVGMGMGMGIGMGTQGMSMANSQMAGGGGIITSNNAGTNNNNNNNNNTNNSSTSGGLEELFQAYGIRYFTAAKLGEMGFTVNTLVHMKEEELEEMMNSLSQFFRWDVLVGERYGIKAAIRAERRRLEDLQDSSLSRRHRNSHSHNNLITYSGTSPPDHSAAHHPLDALSHEGLSEEAGMHEKEVVVSGGGGGSWDMVAAAGVGVGVGPIQYQQRKKHRHPSQQQPPRNNVNGNNMMSSRKGQEGRFMDEEMEDEDEVEDEELDHGTAGGGGVVCMERQREHPFIVTEPGEVARGKKNGLDYLFHLYEQCRDFLLQVQNIAKERGEKCPTKVTNQVFRFAKKAGATYINKPKMRHYVHCYALHCLDVETSNALRRAFKERGENVGAWRQACYKPIVAIASRQGWDIDSIFNSHPRLSIWYVPTKLRQLCHAERSSTAGPSITPDLPF